MKTTVYLILERGGVNRMTKLPPRLGRSEIAVKLSVSVPDSAFKAPTISAALEVPKEAIMQPILTIDVENLAIDAALDEKP